MDPFGFNHFFLYSCPHSGIQTEKANINKAVESKKQKIKEFEDKIESITKDVEKVNADIKERGDKLKGLKKDMKQHKTESKQ